jgi:molybdopterin converting factor small subunit
MMNPLTVSVRLGGGLAHDLGVARLAVALPEGTTIADLRAHLRRQYPHAAERLALAIPVVAGQPVAPEAPLAAGQEVALVMPVSGGSR